MDMTTPRTESDGLSQKTPVRLKKQLATNTVLTNLQRGNTEADLAPERTLNFHERAGQGEISIEQAKALDDIDQEDSHGFTALHYACFYGQFTSVKILVDLKANVNKLAPDLASPLLLAASGGHVEIVKFILAHGADVDHMDIVGNNALIYAAAMNMPQTLSEILVHNPDITHSNEEGNTAFSMAVKNNANLAQAVLENFVMALLNT